MATVVLLALLAGCGEQQKTETKSEPAAPPTPSSEKPKESVAPAPAPAPALAPAPAPPAAELATPPAISLAPPPITPGAPATLTKEQFIAAMETKLKTFDTMIEAYANKAGGYQADAKTQADQALAALREQRGKLTGKFDELKKSGAEAWNDLKSGFDTAVGEMDKAFENAKTKFE